MVDYLGQEGNSVAGSGRGGCPRWGLNLSHEAGPLRNWAP